MKGYARGSRKQNWVSIRLAKNCLFSRRTGYYGTLFLGLSIVVRLFGKDLF